jgi:hypothetical protein
VDGRVVSSDVARGDLRSPRATSLEAVYRGTKKLGILTFRNHASYI